MCRLASCMAPPPETLPPPPLPLSPRRHGRRSIVSAPQSPGASPGCTPAAAGAAGEPQRAERRKPFPSRAGDRMVTCRLQSYRTKRDRRAAALTSWHQQGPVPIMLQLNRAHACPSLAAAHCASCDPGALPLPSSPALGFGPRAQRRRRVPAHQPLAFSHKAVIARPPAWRPSLPAPPL